MVADDVKYSIERIMDPKTGCPRRMEFVNAIDSIEVKDKYTVVFHMKKRMRNCSISSPTSGR